ncbi:MAG: OmpA family protein [Proteobacteria bacterium]|jgi:outer membrane protein OmpA-like peptidoglycan-associated protein|nr:OmpA family protein [Pseudomonadota bacterium]
MRHLVTVMIATMALAACGGGVQDVQSPDTVGTEAGAAPGAAPGGDPAVAYSDTPRDAHGATSSKIKATATEAAMKFFVVDKEKGPVKEVVVTLIDPGGQKYYSEQTDEAGYAEMLVPVGQTYDLYFLGLGTKEIVATSEVPNEPRLSIRTTLIYELERPVKGKPAPRFVLDGVNFDTGKATIRPESYERLDGVVEYMAHKKSARIEISGHTDNVGNKKANKTLSVKRAKACRDYVVSKGIDESRIEAVGYGDERPVAPNTTEDGRQQNRRIEATEL